MRLDQLLVVKGFCATRQEAQEIIERGHVLINGTPLTKQSKNIREDVSIKVLSTRKYVSRGGEKLAGAFAAIFRDEEGVINFINGKSALDVGASTGGFTDFLLKNKVSSVTAVDVGTAQLHESVKKDKRVLSLENTDIRNFSSETKYDIVVADLSFIALRNVIDTILSFGSVGTFFFILIKPQFEVGKGNTKKGVVKDTKLVMETLNEYQILLLERQVKKLQIVPSLIAGGDGNQEYFALFSL